MVKQSQSYKDMIANVSQCYVGAQALCPSCFGYPLNLEYAQPKFFPLQITYYSHAFGHQYKSMKLCVRLQSYLIVMYQYETCLLAITQLIHCPIVGHNQIIDILRA